MNRLPRQVRRPPQAQSGTLTAPFDVIALHLCTGRGYSMMRPGRGGSSTLFP